MDAKHNAHTTLQKLYTHDGHFETTESEVEGA